VNRSHARWTAGITLLFACGEAAPPKADPVGSAEAVASASARPSAASSVTVPPPPPPTLGLVEVHAEKLKGGIDGLFAIDGGVMIVTSEHKVSRVTPEGVEAVGEVNRESPGLGLNIIESVGGKHPDRVHATYHTSNPRAHTPTFWPITGGGGPYVFNPGGGPAGIADVVHVGETTLVVGWDYWSSYQIISARGPIVSRAFTSAEKVGCTLEEVPQHQGMTRRPAMTPSSVAASAAGTMVSLGKICDSDQRGTAIEVWKVGENSSKIVSLKDTEGAKDLSRALGGPGDVVWLVGGNVVLQLEAEKVTPLPPVPGKKPSVFLSSERVLHAGDGQSIHRFEGGAWRKVADLQWSFPPGQLAIGGGETWAIADRKLHRLQPAPSLALAEGCATPFVWLYDVAAISEPSFTFPTTRKALSSFDQVDQLTLIDFQQGVRRLGLTVPSREVGEAVIAHLKTTMKDEQPRLICHAPKGGRTLPIGKAVKP
jgi:hypothetical protein